MKTSKPQKKSLLAVVMEYAEENKIKRGVIRFGLGESISDYPYFHMVTSPPTPKPKRKK